MIGPCILAKVEKMRWETIKILTASSINFVWISDMLLRVEQRQLPLDRRRTNERVWMMLRLQNYLSIALYIV